MQLIFWDILLVLGLIFSSGLLAMAEVGITSARKSRLRDRANRGSRSAAAALALAENAKRLHGAVRVGMTALGTVAAVAAGVRLTPRLDSALERFLPNAPNRTGLSLAAVIAGVAFLILMFAELLPRKIALARPDLIARMFALPMQAIGVVANPIFLGLSALADRVLRVLGIRPRPEPTVTEEEISVLLRQGTKAGVFEAGEQEMIERVFRFSDRRARALMTPRNDIVWIDQTDPPDEIRRKMISSPHSRFPVCDQSLDNVLGIVQVKDLLATSQNGEPFRLKGRLTMPLFLYEGTRGLKILEMFKNSGSRVAVVLDEYGTVEGMLTLTDILEAIVGDMPAGDPDDEPAAVERADGSWLLDGRLPLDEFRARFALPAAVEGEFHTLAGLVVTQLGHIPRVGESFTAFGLRFEVVDMDGNRVDRILVQTVGSGEEKSRDQSS